ncbi:hypothetical protein [Janthinobacterium sp. 75]|uniref:hypothetical protein n=1 Tax=Janthinobacterium sp. 75 TaxID=2135628 RepID=UPI00106380E8|nr:hypothetical protein [Janthinobacterium sp. 75]TDY36014.1 hypothetical protein C8C89_3890 [Janthinobacterium sp. 75]
MNRIPREWLKLTYHRPRIILNGLRRIQCGGQLNGLPYTIAALRTRELKPFLEGRQAALFCHGIGTRIGREVSFALFESADYDIVARYEDGGVMRMVPVQLKELPPSAVNSNVDLQQILDKLGKKLPDSKDLVVAIHLNRDIQGLHTEGLRIPTGFGQIWLYGGKNHTQQAWSLIGDLLKNSNLVSDFHYPSDMIYSAMWQQDIIGRCLGSISLSFGLNPICQ